ncbi:Phosphorylase b kinase regulatory subunit beta [Lamellibrachia satsuma]|nr:Phosphorylase b kinase regulatory subunit beta [Lamellibrachia satsuma]
MLIKRNLKDTFSNVETFDGIECEWPLFAIYFLIDSIFKRDKEQADHYQHMVKSLIIPSKSGPIVPKYYYLSSHTIDDERSAPGSQTRYPSSEGQDGNLFLWGQSVYIISQLLVEGLLNVNELDPIRRHLPAAERPRPNSRYSSFQSSPSDLVIQVALISESVRLQQMLSTYGIQTQTPHQVEPIQIWPPSELAKAYEQLGVNHKLGLSGRPPRPVGGLGTGKIYRAGGSTVICYPLLFETSDFYLCQDMRLVLDDVKTDLAFLSKCWKLAGRPTFCMIIREDNLRGPNARYIFQLLAQFKRGDCDGIKVRLGRLQEFISSACIEHLDFLTVRNADQMTFHPFVEMDMLTKFRSLTSIAAPASIDNQQENWVDLKTLTNKSNFDLTQMLYESTDLYCQMQILQVFLNREGLFYCIDDLNIKDRLESLCRYAGNHQLWAVVRFGASLLGKVVDSLAPSITSILVRGKHVTIGVFGHDEEVIEKPISPQGIKHILYHKCFPHDIIQAVLQQELLLNIGKFITTNPKLFDGMLKIRIGWVVQALKLELSNCKGREMSLNVLSPSAIKRLLLQVLTCSSHRELLQSYVRGCSSHRSVLWNRQLDGALNRVPPDFYDRVWHILERTAGGLKVAGYHLPQQPTLSDMTQYELNFSLLVEQMLSKIVDPTYRQIIVESFMVVDVILTRNLEVSFSKVVDMDKLVYEALQLFRADRERDGESTGDLEDDMQAFYNMPPNVQCGTTSYIAKAIVNNLLDGHLMPSSSSKTTCHLS